MDAQWQSHITNLGGILTGLGILAKYAGGRLEDCKVTIATGGGEICVGPGEEFGAVGEDDRRRLEALGWRYGEWSGTWRLRV